ncbi:hypothetical protein BG011_003643 [Mortierella polycephala]|uniref:MICOS complex subunit n=1 Tax=Mortierella polycephala TaxID=41804 RepID=A0A9P6QDG7_9FUNG|nr:hypothetical protein BG011_003643 [Mortierella polycephala]
MSLPSDNNTYRRLKADQEPLLPGLAYAGAAGIGGSVLVYRVRSVPIRVLTPLAFAAVAGSYFLPAHTDLIKSRWMPMRMSKTDDVVPNSPLSTMRDLKQGAEEVASDLEHKTKETVDDVSRQAQANWVDIKQKSENLAEAYREAGQEKVSNAVEKSVSGAKSWLDRQKNEADHLLEETSSILSASSFPSTASNRDNNKFHGSAAREQSQEQPSSSRWSWWSQSDSISPKKDVENKIDSKTDTAPEVKRVKRPESDPKMREKKSEDEKNPLLLVDKNRASLAVKGHDDAVNRAALERKDAEERGLKVYDNVNDASLPKDLQSSIVKIPIEVARKAAESDIKDGKYIVRELKEPPGQFERVIPSKSKKDIDHGLQNLDKRAHMLYDGVEHLEHKINERIQKSLQAEADFWHQQSLKEEAKTRGGERGM